MASGPHTSSANLSSEQSGQGKLLDLQVAENPLSFARTIMASLLDGTKYNEDLILELETLISEKKHGH